MLLWHRLTIPSFPSWAIHYLLSLEGILIGNHDGIFYCHSKSVFENWNSMTHFVNACPPLSQSLSLCLSLTHTHTLSLTISHTLSLSLSFSLLPFLSFSHSDVVSIDIFIFEHTHTHTHTQRERQRTKWESFERSKMSFFIHSHCSHFERTHKDVFFPYNQIARPKERVKAVKSVWRMSRVGLIHLTLF